MYIWNAFNFSKIIKIFHVPYCYNTKVDDIKNNQIHTSDKYLVVYNLLLSQSL